MTHVPKRATSPTQFMPFSARSQTLQPPHHCPLDLSWCPDPSVVLAAETCSPRASAWGTSPLSAQAGGWAQGGITVVKALHAVEQSGLQAGLSPFGLFHCFLCQGVKLRKIWPGKSRALRSTKERNSCRIPGTANVNRAPLVLVQLKGWVSPPPGCGTLISLTTVIPPV